MMEPQIQQKLPEDPFGNSTPKLDQRKSSYRFSSFDTQLFANYQPSASPATAKRALEAHLLETDRRLEEAHRLGTALIQQRQDLAEHLKEIEQQQNGQEIGPELRQRLSEVEREYNELSRESARAFLTHKPRNANTEENGNSIALEPKPPGSPTKFSSQATDSPSKVSVPSRRQRNQPTNRVDDIEFVTQISTSLLSQVRQLQIVLAERDESLKALNVEKSRLELETEGLGQRIKSLDENEQRYKDENWSLETQTHELIANAKENASKEQRLQQNLALATSQKNAAQRDLDDVKQSHGKLLDDYTAFRKAHDSEAAGLRKAASVAENEQNALQRKIEELTSQNQELAKAVAGRFRLDGEVLPEEIGSEPEDFSLDRSDPEHSPPPSPSKGVTRNSILESETLKSSLHHAHRMIQTLKTNIHREKTEKLELKRMLQESRDELELRRNESGLGSASKRLKTKSQQELARRTGKLNQLGAGRHTRTNVELEDPEWQDHERDLQVTENVPAQLRPTLRQADTSDTYQTATEAEDSFETANERETETEAFQTGNESLNGDSSDDLTETESGVDRISTVKEKRISSIATAKRSSFVSTASTSDDEGISEARTPVQQPMKYRVKLGRGSRRSRVGSEEPTSSPVGVKSSPASFLGNVGQKGQSLFAELGDFEDQSEDGIEGTPDKSIATPVSLGPFGTLFNSSLRHSSPPMVDSATMTDPWTPEPSTESLAAHHLSPAAVAGGMEEVTSDTVRRNLPERISSQARLDDINNGHGPTPETLAINVLSSSVEASTSATNEPTSSGDQDTQIGKPKMEPEVLAFSPISSREIWPSELPPKVPVKDPARPSTALRDSLTIHGSPTQHQAQDSAKGGVLGSVLGWAIGQKQSPPETVGEGDKVPSTHEQAKAKIPFKEVSPNIMRRESALEKVDSSSQTTLSSLQIDSLISTRATKPSMLDTSFMAQAKPDPSLLTKNASQPSPALATTPTSAREVAFLPKSVRRLSSASSVRASNSDVPPLPVDHRQAIAAAQQFPVKERNESKTDGNMGPPVAPASSYRPTSRRAQTANEQTIQSPASIGPRPRYSTARSSRSRRSSVSSFESELDARFNIRADGLPTPHGTDSGTDPRMIQAITQTMIGEYLWKYTRKAGRGEMSDKRHRRFFWVHPYTRTLYWSDQDPSTAGRVQLKAKSVAIEAVRVVVDDNPLPPGLHRKSLIVITPGRDVKFTATTGQRHETWFNALSYLLLRSNTEPQLADPNNITAEDVAEFNPGFRRLAGSRVSLSSYNSRTNTTRRSIMSSRTASPNKGSVRQIPATPHATTSSRLSHTNQASLGSRISNYWRPNRASVVNNRDGAISASTGSIYNASVVNDSAEDVRQVLERQDREADRLENVRACCDGKHDVGSLNRRSIVGRVGSSSRR